MPGCAWTQLCFRMCFQEEDFIQYTQSTSLLTLIFIHKCQISFWTNSFSGLAPEPVSELRIKTKNEGLCTYTSKNILYKFLPNEKCLLDQHDFILDYKNNLAQHEYLFCKEQITVRLWPLITKKGTRYSSTRCK